LETLPTLEEAVLTVDNCPALLVRVQSLHPNYSLPTLEVAMSAVDDCPFLLSHADKRNFGAKA